MVAGRSNVSVDVHFVNIGNLCHIPWVQHAVKPSTFRTNNAAVIRRSNDAATNSLFRPLFKRQGKSRHYFCWPCPHAVHHIPEKERPPPPP